MQVLANQSCRGILPVTHWFRLDLLCSMFMQWNFASAVIAMKRSTLNNTERTWIQTMLHTTYSIFYSPNWVYSFQASKFEMCKNEIRFEICIQLILLFVKHRMIIIIEWYCTWWLCNYVLFEAKYLHQWKFENVSCVTQ